ncbi:MAG: hypothetical protein Q8R82_16260 [Hyphomonadaceae bacterium]|nr:hypothetical protein [Hyphomonadaceae bacterium]
MVRLGGMQALTGLIGLALVLSACGDQKPGVTEPSAAPSAIAPPNAKLAMLAVFPDAVNGEVAIPASGGALARVERPVTVIAGEAGRFYLVKAKEVTAGCHACSASVSVYYLRDTNGALSLSAPYRDLYESGGWGEAGEITALTLPRNGGVGMTDESGFTAQGCTVTNVSVYRFDESGPKDILDRAPLGRSQDAIDIGGTVIRPYTPDTDFAINYSGNANSVPIDATVMWTMENGVLVQSSGMIPEAVASGC